MSEETFTLNLSLSGKDGLVPIDRHHRRVLTLRRRAYRQVETIPVNVVGKCRPDLNHQRQSRPEVAFAAIYTLGAVSNRALSTRL